MCRRWLQQPAWRFAWVVGLVLTNWVVCLLATLDGYGLADSRPLLVRQGLVFVGPLYFLLILVAETRTRQGALALALGTIVGPLVHLVSPQWSVIAGGLIGGTVAWALRRGTGSSDGTAARRGNGQGSGNG